MGARAARVLAQHTTQSRATQAAAERAWVRLAALRVWHGTHAPHSTTRRKAHGAPRYSQGTAGVLTGYCSSTPCGHLELTVALCLPHCYRSRTSTGTASRSCARSCRWASAMLSAVPRSSLQSTMVLGATREWRNKPEASRSMGGHRLPCPYKLAATCPPSLPHPQPRQPRRIGIRHADQLAR